MKKHLEIDPIEELHKYRASYAKKFNYNLDEIFKDLLKKEKKDKIRTVNLSRSPSHHVEATRKDNRFLSSMKKSL